ncbi:MAG: DUF917 domain-containing protein [Thermomicrobiales bacterium]|nr:DUF917 domain-containing protein [Thermomicrobiales bacterium]
MSATAVHSFAARLPSVERRVAKGFSRGEVIIDGLDDNRGDTLHIDFQNENLIARRGEEVLASVPDLICIVDSVTAEPITTEVLRYGLRVTVLGIPAPRLLKTPEALAVVGPGAFGYDVPFVALPGVYGSEL